MSMAIGGPLLGIVVWQLLRKHTPMWFSVFVTVFVTDLFTYVITSTQLALAFPDPVGGFGASWVKFAAIFAVTQIPLAISEGIMGVLVFKALESTAQEEFKQLGLEGI
jgi:cobalt/nickel transport system permease protein